MSRILDQDIDVNKLSNSVRVLFEYPDGTKKEFIKPITCNIQWSIDNGFVMKKATIEGVGNKEIRDFLSELSLLGKMLVSVYVNGLLFTRSWLTHGMLNYYYDSNYGIIVNFNIFDRFIGIKTSNIIRTKPVNNSILQQFLVNILDELDFMSPEYINSYSERVVKGFELIRNGIGVESYVPLKTFKKDPFLQEEGSSLVGECLSLCNVLLVSNSYDALTLERPNSNPFTIATINSQVNNDISYIGKVGDVDSENSVTPSTVLILNSRGNEKQFKDPNTSITAPCHFGLPNVLRVNNVNFDATYKQIASMLDYNFAGIKAREDSFLIKLKDRVLTSDGKDFYQPNRRVSVYVPELGLEQNMVILQMGCNISAQQGTELVLNVSSETSFTNNSTLRHKVALMN
jgi:hypothetical protein